jgi:hypothetical protein
MSSLLERLVDSECAEYQSDEDFARDCGDYLLPLDDTEEGKKARESLRYSLNSLNFWVTQSMGINSQDPETALLRADSITRQKGIIAEIVYNAFLASTRGVQ